MRINIQKISNGEELGWRGQNPYSLLQRHHEAGCVGCGPTSVLAIGHGHLGRLGEFDVLVPHCCPGWVLGCREALRHRSGVGKRSLRHRTPGADWVSASLRQGLGTWFSGSWIPVHGWEPQKSWEPSGDPLAGFSPHGEEEWLGVQRGLL
jgi:hypothetical protein